ncbi:hypothetical protein BZG36_05252, partial [Bifiguratus adelaidae]
CHYPLMAHTFTWAHGGEHVLIAGTFDELPPWQPIPMEKDANGVHTLTIKLIPGKHYEYKFVVDGTWTTDNTQPTVQDAQGNVNNCCTVESTLPLVEAGNSLMDDMATRGLVESSRDLDTAPSEHISANEKDEDMAVQVNASTHQVVPVHVEEADNAGNNTQRQSMVNDGIDETWDYQHPMTVAPGSEVNVKFLRETVPTPMVEEQHFLEEVPEDGDREEPEDYFPNNVHAAAANDNDDEDADNAHIVPQELDEKVDLGSAPASVPENGSANATVLSSAAKPLNDGIDSLTERMTSLGHQADDLEPEDKENIPSSLLNPIPEKPTPGAAVARGVAAAAALPSIAHIINEAPSADISQSTSGSTISTPIDKSIPPVESTEDYVVVADTDRITDELAQGGPDYIPPQHQQQVAMETLVGGQETAAEVEAATAASIDLPRLRERKSVTHPVPEQGIPSQATEQAEAIPTVDVSSLIINAGKIVLFAVVAYMLLHGGFSKEAQQPPRM